MDDIRQFTANYVAAFNDRDLDRVASYMSEAFELTDPEVTRLTPKKDVLNYIGGVFDANGTLRFKANKILVVLDGVDVIKWASGKMTSMHAYLTPRR
jgi:ketosteroid isomerase-like protein